MPATTAPAGKSSAGSRGIHHPGGLVAIGAITVHSRCVPAAPEVLRTVRLRKTFESEGSPVRALRGIDVVVGRGEFVAVTGPSGCGKSTLLNVVAGLETPSDGEVVLAGESLAGQGRERAGAPAPPAHRLRLPVLQPARGGDGPRERHARRRRRRRVTRRAEVRARELLDLSASARRRAELPGVLSGGQRQRLAIARALANEPTLLLADEPTGALDTAGGLEVLDLFRRLHEGGQTILLVTHDGQVAATTPS